MVKPSIPLHYINFPSTRTALIAVVAGSPYTVLEVRRVSKPASSGNRQLEIHQLDTECKTDTSTFHPKERKLWICPFSESLSL